MTALFVSFEGPEGSGKSLQARRLVERLRARGVRVTPTHEPGGTALGDQLRQIALLRPELETGARAEALLMCAARAQLVERVIRPALARGEVVVCDRFADSTLAYQGYGRGLGPAALAPVVAFATAGLQPDLTILLDVPVDAGLARKMAQRAPGDATAGPAWNRFEAEAGAFHQRVRAGYRALAAGAPGRWRCLDGLGPPDELARIIWDQVAARVGLP